MFIKRTKCAISFLCFCLPLYLSPTPLSDTHTQGVACFFFFLVSLQLRAGLSTLNLVAQGKASIKSWECAKACRTVFIEINTEPSFKGSALVILVLLPLPSALASCTYCGFKFLLRTQAHMMHSTFNSGPSVNQHKLTEFLLKVQALWGSLLASALWIPLISSRVPINSLFFHWWFCLFQFSLWKHRLYFGFSPSFQNWSTILILVRAEVCSFNSWETCLPFFTFPLHWHLQ